VKTPAVSPFALLGVSSAKELPRRLLATLIRGYQRFLSPALPPSCRFHPSCSQYALDAVTRHGALKGTWLTARRLARCHPFNPGGFDPVP
jgi:putative membrane protein insertion efficiency factor